MKELVIIFLFAISAAIKVELTDYVCEEPHGYFPDPEQCDLYYECKNGVATPKLCPDGLLFLLGEAISVKCDYPFNIDCGSREFVQEPEPNIDPKCYRANGYFNHEDATVCDRFYNCVNGVAYELPCAAGLIFDEAIGTCVREEQASSYAKRCVKSSEKDKRYSSSISFLANIDGFLCPEEETIGPHGQIACFLLKQVSLKYFFKLRMNFDERIKMHNSKSENLVSFSPSHIRDFRIQRVVNVLLLVISAKILENWDVEKERFLMIEQRNVFCLKMALSIGDLILKENVIRLMLVQL
eukprot:TCALIF_13280-PA protein Name:"Protein of unknown function" AED:0.12 eAED:0.41 QI:117/0.5/0.42/1/0.33/0.42/7/0/296